MDQTVTIADIEDEVLLGADVLFRDPTELADLIFSRSQMLFRGSLYRLRELEFNR